MSKYDITIRDDQALPQGYRYGAHLSGPGWSGYYVLREDGASLVARVEPVLLPDVTADDLDQAIRESQRAAEG